MLIGGRLWGQRDFLKLWSGQTISEIGSAVTQLALPSAAILQLHAGPLQVGLLAACERLPFPILALFAGVWVDRARRRPLMIAADVGRALALASVPAAAVLHALTLLQLYAVALLVGAFTVLFDVAYLAYLPALVGGQDIVEGNTKMQISYSIASLAGPGLGGLLVQLFGAAKAVGINAASFLVSVATLVAIRRHEPSPRHADVAPTSVVADIREGVRLVYHHPILRSLLLTLTVSSSGFHLAEPVIYIYAYTVLHLSPAVVGLFFALSGIGSFVGALFATPAVRRFGLGRTLVVAQVLSALTFVGIPLASILSPIPVLATLFLLLGVTDIIFDINQVSLRQGYTPNRLQGRMNATFRTLFWGSWPVASFVGGALAAGIGPVPAILIGGAIALSSTGVILATPLGRLREHPPEATAG